MIMAESAKRMVMASLALAVAILVLATSVQSICHLSIEELGSCKPAVMLRSNLGPTSECCKALTKADLSCVCRYRAHPVLLSIGVDPDRVKGLPGKCQLQIPTNC